MTREKDTGLGNKARLFPDAHPMDVAYLMVSSAMFTRDGLIENNSSITAVGVQGRTIVVRKTI